MEVRTLSLGFLLANSFTDTFDCGSFCAPGFSVSVPLSRTVVLSGFFSSGSCFSIGGSIPSLSSIASASSGWASSFLFAAQLMYNHVNVAVAAHETVLNLLSFMYFKTLHMRESFFAISATSSIVFPSSIPANFFAMECVSFTDSFALPTTFGQNFFMKSSTCDCSTLFPRATSFFSSSVAHGTLLNFFNAEGAIFNAHLTIESNAFLPHANAGTYDTTSRVAFPSGVSDHLLSDTSIFCNVSRASANCLSMYDFPSHKFVQFPPVNALVAMSTTNFGTSSSMSTVSIADTTHERHSSFIQSHAKSPTFHIQSTTFFADDDIAFPVFLPAESAMVMVC